MENIPQASRQNSSVFPFGASRLMGRLASFHAQPFGRFSSLRFHRPEDHSSLMMPSKLWLPKKPLGSLGSPKKTLNKEPDEPQTILSNGKQLKNSSNNCRKFNKEKYFLEMPGPGYSGHSKDLQNHSGLEMSLNFLKSNTRNL